MTTTAAQSFDPLWFWRLPLSGDVNQRITVNYAGNTLIEDRVITEVASFGRQIGWLSEIAVARTRSMRAARRNSQTTGPPIFACFR